MFIEVQCIRRGCSLTVSHYLESTVRSHACTSAHTNACIHNVSIIFMYIYIQHMPACMCILMHIHRDTHVYIHTYVRIYVDARIWSCIYTCMCNFVFVHAYQDFKYWCWCGYLSIISIVLVMV